MNTKQLFRKGLMAFLSIFVIASVMLGGDLKNKGTITNKAGKTLRVANGNFINYNGASWGTVNNAGQITVTVGSFLNNLASATVTNYYQGTAGTVTVGDSYDNTAGTTANDSAGVSKVGTLNIADSLYIPSGTFTTTMGRVTFDGGGNQYIPAPTGGYGTLAILGTAGWKSLVASTSVNDSMRINSTFSDSAFTLTVSAPTGITSDAGSGGQLRGQTGTVSYAADANQAVFPSPYYNNLTLTTGAATSKRNKQAAGAVTLAGTLTIGTYDSLDVTGAFTLSSTGTLLNSGGLKLAGNADFTTATMTTPGTVVYYGTSPQTVATGSFAYDNLVFRDSSAAKNIAGNINVSGSVTLEAIGRTKVVISSGTFSYTGAATAQTVAALDYSALSFSNAAQKNVSGWVNAASGVTVASSVTGTGLYIASTGTLNVTGDLTNDGNITNDGTVIVN